MTRRKQRVLYFLMRKTPSGPISNWFNGNRVLFNQGVSGEGTPLTGSLKQWFDIVVFLRSTTPVHSLLP